MKTGKRASRSLLKGSHLSSENSRQSNALLELRSGRREQLPRDLEQRHCLGHLTDDLNSSIFVSTGSNAIFKSGIRCRFFGELIQQTVVSFGDISTSIFIADQELLQKAGESKVLL